MRLRLVEQQKNGELFVNWRPNFIQFVGVDRGHGYNEDWVIFWLCTGEHVGKLLSAKLEGDSPSVIGESNGLS